MLNFPTQLRIHHSLTHTHTHTCIHTHKNTHSRSINAFKLGNLKRSVWWRATLEQEGVHKKHRKNKGYYVEIKQLCERSKNLYQYKLQQVKTKPVDAELLCDGHQTKGVSIRGKMFWSIHMCRVVIEMPPNLKLNYKVGQNSQCVENLFKSMKLLMKLLT